jgi:hypothetical protein
MMTRGTTAVGDRGTTVGERGDQEQPASTPAEPLAGAERSDGNGLQGPDEAVAVVGGRQAPARRRRVARRGATAPAAASGAGGQAEASAGAAPSAAGSGGAEEGTQVDEADGARADRERRRRVTAGALVVRRAVATTAMAVLVVAVAAAAFFGVSWSSANGQLQQRAAVQAAAHSFVLDLSNLSTKDVDVWYRSLLGASTGRFATQAKAFFGGGVLSELKAAKAAEQGTIWALQVTSIHGDTATASAVVYESYDNSALASAGKGVQHDTVWLDLTLERTSSGWKVSDVTARNGATGGLLTPNTTPTPASPGSSSPGG